MHMREIILEKLRREEASCVICREGVILYEGKGRGVAPLLSAYHTDASLFHGAFVYDTVIGKAAACLLVLGGASGAYGELMSESALTFLRAHGIEAQYAELAPHIRNRRGDGLCPMEEAVLEAQSAQEGYARLLEAVRRLQKNI